jgi:hypothetical protein
LGQPVGNALKLQLEETPADEMPVRH